MRAWTGRKGICIEDGTLLFKRINDGDNYIRRRRYSIAFPCLLVNGLLKLPVDDEVTIQSKKPDKASTCVKSICPPAMYTDYTGVGTSHHLLKIFYFYFFLTDISTYRPDAVDPIFRLM